MDSFFSLINNAVLLIALVVIYDSITLAKITPYKYHHSLSGFFIGIIVINVMNNPWEFQSGIFIDTRWILLSLSGLFFGFIPTLIAALLAACFHIYQGDAGLYVGTLVIFSSSGIGLGWRYWMQAANKQLNWQSLLAMGIVVEIAVLCSLLLMPDADKYHLILTISPVLLIVYTCGNMLIGLLLKQRLDSQQLAHKSHHHKYLLETEKNILQRIIDGIPDLIYYKSTAGIYLGFNKAFADSLQLKPEKIKNQNDYDLFDPQQAERFIKADNLVLHQNRQRMNEEWVTTPDGMAHIFSTQKTPFTNASGNIQGFVGISRDLTVQKHIEKQLRHSEITYRNIISTAQDGFVMVSVNGMIIESNQSFANMTGYTLAELVDKPFNQIDTNERQTFSTENSISAKQTKNRSDTSMYKHKQGHLFHVDVNVSFLDGDDGMFFCFVKDITGRINTEQKLLRSESKFKQLFETITSVPVQGFNKHRSVIFWNQASEKLYGYTKEQAIGQKLEDLIIPFQYKEQIIHDVNTWINEGVAIPSVELILKHVDGSPVAVDSSQTIIYNTENEAEIYSMDIDLTAQKTAEEQALILSQAIAQCPVSMILTNIDSKIEYVNTAFEKITGYTASEVIGQSASMQKSDLTPKSLYKELWNTITKGKIWQGELQNKKKNGDIFWEHAHIAPIFNNEGVIKHYFALKQDVTRYKQQEETILHQAHYDNLTRLPNRLLSRARLSQMLKEAQSAKNNLAVLFLDLDDFKKVNDTLGHAVGDKLLIQAAARLNDTIGESDHLGRLGGDEFIIILGNINESAEVEVIANNLLKRFKAPFTLQCHELVSTISIGIACFPFDSKNPTELLRQADSAMYHSKEHGRNTYNFFTHEMNHDINRRMKIEEQLLSALKRQELEVYFQPLVNMRSRKIIGAEALLRWNNELLGQVTPDEFIPIAEQSGLIVAIGQFVIEQAFLAAKKWQLAFDPRFKIAINVSPKQFRENTFVELLKIQLDHYHINASSVELEITEGVLLSGDPVIDSNLTRINHIGVSISMDDFGTGYSSLSYLRSYPFDTLKVDKSFIQDITVDPGDLELVGAAIAMGHGLKLTVVAEGVETEEQYQLLNTLKCDLGQGYLFSKPLPQAAFEDLLQAQAQDEMCDKIVFL